MRPIFTRRTLGLLAALTLMSAAQAQNWPNKPLRIVVPYPPGGSSDIIARAISQQLSDTFKQSVIVENKPGANGNTGSDMVAKSTDGHTFLLCDVGALAISPSVYTKLPFDPSKDLRGVTMLAYSPHLLVVHPSVTANNLQELVQLSRQQALNFAVSAIGSAPHLAGVAVEKATQAQWNYIPYKGGPSHWRHRGRTNPNSDEWHVGHLAACAVGQTQSAGRVQSHPRAFVGQCADAGRARRQRF